MRHPVSALASGLSAGPLPSRPAIPSGAEPGHRQSLRTGCAWRGAGPLAPRGLQGRPTYLSDEGLS